MPIRNWAQNTGSWFDQAEWLEGSIPTGADDVYADDGVINVDGFLTANANTVHLRDNVLLIATTNFNIVNGLYLGDAGVVGGLFARIQGGTTTAGLISLGAATDASMEVSGSGVLTTTGSFTIGGGGQAGDGHLRIFNGGTVNSSTAIAVGNSNSSSSITIGGPASGSAEGAGTLNADVVLDSAGALNFRTSNSATYGGVLSGSGALNINSPNAGAITFTGQSTFSGTTTISADSYLLLNGGTLGGINGGNIVNNGLLTHFNTTATIGGVVSGSGTFRVGGTSNVTLTNTNTYSGVTEISGSTLNIGNGGTTGSLGTGAVTNEGLLRFNRSDNETIANTISGSGGVTVQSGGITTFDANNTYSGITTIEAGAILRLGLFGMTGTLGTGAVVNNGALYFTRSGTASIANDISGSGYVQTGHTGTTVFTANNSYSGGTTVGAASTLEVGTFGGTTGSLGTGNIANDGLLAFMRGNDETIANAISGSGAVGISAGGTTTFTASNSYSGATTIFLGGTLQIGNGGTTGSLGTGAVINNGTLHFNRSDIEFIHNAISGGGDVTISGGGPTVFFGNNTYTGTTTINSGGALAIGTVGTTGSLGTGAVVNNGELSFSRIDDDTVTNAISGSGSVWINFSGITTFTGNNSYGGETRINLGATLQIGNGGTTGSLGTGAYSGVGSPMGSLSGGAVINNGTLHFNRTNDDTLARAISGSGAVEISGGGITLFTANNSYSGPTTINSGAYLRVGLSGETDFVSNGRLGSGAIINNGTLEYWAHTGYVIDNSISGTGNIIFRFGSFGNNLGFTLTADSTYTGTTEIISIVSGSRDFKIGDGGTTGSLGTGAVTMDSLITLHFNRSNDETVVNTISGGGKVAISGGGITTFTGNNSYTGTTTINAGATLQIGNGGTTGSLGTGAVNNSGALVFNRSDIETVANVISGNGSVIIAGHPGIGGGMTAGVTTFTASNSHTGVTQVGTRATLALSGTGSIATSSAVQLDEHGYDSGPPVPNSGGRLDISAISGAGTSIRSLQAAPGSTIILGGHTLTVTAAETLTGLSGLTVIGSTGTDALVFNLATSQEQYTLAGVTFGTFSSYHSNGLINYTAWTDGADSIVINGNALGNILTGAAANATTLEGFGGDDTLIGGSANDRLYGGADNDTLRGGAGADIIDGGNGTDTADYTGSIGGVTINLLTNSASGGDAAGDTLSSIENVTGGSGADVLTGNALANILSGGAGADQLFGGDGDDRLLFDALDTMVNGGNGTDTAVFSGTGTFTAGLSGIERLELTSGSNLTIASSLIGAGFAANMPLIGSGTLTIQMAAPSTLSITNMAVQAGASAGITINGSSGIDLVKGSLTAVNTINGNDGNDQLRGGTLADVINGGIGNDKILGFTGADVLTGGSGSDQFRYLFATDSGLGAAADRITDFTIGSDRLNLALLDADPVTPGDQAFNFIGTGAFANTGVGQVRYQTSGGDLLVQVDLDGNGTADMEMILQGIGGQSMTSGDFLL